MRANWRTIPEMFFEQARRYGQRAVLKVKRAGTYQPISWRQLASQVEAIALSLIDSGLKPGDRVALLSENRPEWAASDLAILASGGVTVPIYTTLTSPEIGYILRDSGARFAFLSGPEALGKVLAFQEELDLKAILFDAPYRVTGPRIWWLGEFEGLGKTAGPTLRQELQRRIDQAKPEDLASIIYTSGTTGPAKGVMLTHGNFLSNCSSVKEVLPVTEKDEILSFLPLSHVFERMAGYYFVLFVGGTIAYAENMETVSQNLLEVRPTVATGVPRFYEKIYERIQESVRTSGALKRKIFAWATRVGEKQSQRSLAGSPVHFFLKLKAQIADRLVFSKLRARLGGRLRFFVSGGAPLSKDLAEFFYLAGVLILEGYGLTETSPVISVNRPDRFRFGSVGPPLPGVEVKIAPDGEILTRGPHVMKGYFNKPQATQEVIDSQGWFHTGDIGILDQQGFLKITDRKKDLIKTSGGKLVAPQNLENALKNDPFIADCVILGDRRKYVTALIVPHMERLKEMARQWSLPSEKPTFLIQQPKVFDLIWQRIEALNKDLAPFEQIKKITLLPEPFTIASGELTPTMKVKRQVVAQRYSAQIEAMYAE